MEWGTTSRGRYRLAKIAAIVAASSLFLFIIHGSLLRLVTHGMTWDEHPQMQSLRANMDLAISGAEPQLVKDFRGQQEYYGIVNKLPGLLLWRTIQFARGDDLGLWQYDRSALIAFHSTAIAFGLLAVWGCARTARLWPGGPIPSIAAPALLLLYPRFLGHAFFDLKDIPFAALYTLLTFRMVEAVVATSAAASRRASVHAILVGGMLVAIKTPGVVAMWPLVLAGLFAPHLAGRARPGAGLRFAWTMSPLLALAIAVVSTPAAWRDPLDWIQGAIGLFGQYPWERCTMTWGECIPATDTPPDYLLRWFAVTTPVTLLILFGWAIVELFRSPLFRAPLGVEAGKPSVAASGVSFAIVAAQLVTFPILAIGSGAALYDAERHFLFVVPAACTIAAFGLARLVERSSAWRPLLRTVTGCALAIGALGVIVDGWRLHPYQYSYYNEIGRHLQPSRNFETDFWGFSLGELVRRRLVAHPDPKKWGAVPVVAMPNTVYPFTPTLPANYRRTVELVTAASQPYPRVQSTTLVFGINRFEWREPPRECQQVDVEERRLLFAATPLVMGRTLVCEPQRELRP